MEVGAGLGGGWRREIEGGCLEEEEACLEAGGERGGLGRVAEIEGILVVGVAVAATGPAVFRRCRQCRER